MFILASSSPRRLGLLKDIGINPTQVVSADIDESPMKDELPRALALRLASEKLAAVLGRLGSTEERAWVLAADTVVACGRRVLPKAEQDHEVVACLKLLSGRRHRVHTGIAIRAPDGQVISRVIDSVVMFRPLNQGDITAYVGSGEGLGKAGGYAIQGRAASLIKYISGSYSNIVGLPLYEVSQVLAGMGYKG